MARKRGGSKGTGRTGSITLGSKPVDQTRGGVAAGGSFVSQPVRSGRPANKATGQPIKNGRPVRQAVGLNPVVNNRQRSTRTGNPPASATRSGIGGVTAIRDGSGKKVNQTVTPGSAGNFPRSALRTGSGPTRQHPSMTKGNFVRGRRVNSNSGRLGTIGIEQAGPGGPTVK